MLQLKIGENLSFPLICVHHISSRQRSIEMFDETNLLRVRTNRPNLTSTMPGHVAAEICKRSIWGKYSTRQDFYKLVHGQKCKCLKLTFLVQV